MHGPAGGVDAAATYDPETRATAVFAVNRSLTDPVTLEIDVELLGGVGEVSATTLHDDDIHAANTLADRERVAPRENTTVRLGDASVGITLPPVSWTAISLRTRSTAA